jgi:hypothetical protein
MSSSLAFIMMATSIGGQREGAFAWKSLLGKEKTKTTLIAETRNCSGEHFSGGLSVSHVAAARINR